MDDVQPHRPQRRKSRDSYGDDDVEKIGRMSQQLYLDNSYLLESEKVDGAKLKRRGSIGAQMQREISRKLREATVSDLVARDNELGDRAQQIEAEVNQDISRRRKSLDGSAKIEGQDSHKQAERALRRRQDRVRRRSTFHTIEDAKILSFSAAAVQGDTNSLPAVTAGASPKGRHQDASTAAKEAIDAAKRLEEAAASRVGLIAEARAKVRELQELVDSELNSTAAVRKQVAPRRPSFSGLLTRKKAAADSTTTTKEATEVAPRRPSFSGLLTRTKAAVDSTMTNAVAAAKPRRLPKLKQQEKQEEKQETWDQHKGKGAFVDAAHLDAVKQAMLDGQMAQRQQRDRRSLDQALLQNPNFEPVPPVRRPSLGEVLDPRRLRRPSLNDAVTFVAGLFGRERQPEKKETTMADIGASMMVLVRRKSGQGGAARVIQAAWRDYWAYVTILRAVMCIQRTYRSYHSWVIRTRWLMLIRMEREEKEKREKTTETVRIKRQKRKKETQRAERRLSLRAASRNGAWDASDMRAKQRHFTRLQEAKLIACKVGHGLPTENSKEAWAVYYKAFPMKAKNIVRAKAREMEQSGELNQTERIAELEDEVVRELIPNWGLTEQQVREMEMQKERERKGGYGRR